MSFKNPERIRRLAKAAVAEQELADALQASRIPVERMIRNVAERGEEVWMHAIEDTLIYDNMERELDGVRSGNDSLLGTAAGLAQTERVNELKGHFILGATWLVLFIIAAAIMIAGKGMADGVGTLLNSNWWRIPGGALLVLTGIALLRWIRGSRRFAAWNAARSELVEKTGFRAGEEKLRQLREAIEARLLNEGVKPLIRQIINEELEPNYEPRLGRIEAPGLSEVLNTTQTIETESKARLHYLLHSMPGGSIGIAGPRGAGKSTLLQSYCGASRTIESINGRAILPVLTSAPVQYDARDFILYLFASTCRSLLKQEGVNELESDWTGSEAATAANNAIPTAALIRKAGKAALTGGLLLLAFSLFIYLASYSNAPGLPHTNLFKDLEIKPGPYANAAMSLLLGGLVISLVFSKRPEYLAKELLRRWRVLTRANKSSEPEAVPAPAENPTVRFAREWLKKIRFQQTFTSGWSGALKTPIGLEGGMSGAMTFAERQMSNPEIVYEFVSFLNRIPQQYVVIIGIDEMDKLESEEQAQKFLNEIKSIFGLARCFYLISVSENAMSNFERRGLPFRDVFDSSFDTIVYVNYLQLQEAAALLERRVIGRPIPFFHLAYCLSGGLARDLIRVFRQIVALSDAPAASSLDETARGLVTGEVRAKVRAINFLVKKVDAVPEADSLFQILFQLDDKALNAAELIKRIAALHGWQATATTAAAALAGNKDQKELCQKYEGLLSLSEELATYLMLMVTLLELFNHRIDESALRAAVAGGTYDRIARARQSLAVDPCLARSIISSFRQDLGLAELGLPAANSGKS